MGAFIDGTFSVVFYLAAPENDAPTLVGRLKLEPDIESVNGATREEVSDLPRAHNDIDTIRLSGPDHRVDAIQRPRERRNRDIPCSSTEISFLTYGERCRQWRTGQRRIGSFNFTRWRQSENIETQDTVLQELYDCVHLLRVIVHDRK